MEELNSMSTQKKKGKTVQDALLLRSKLIEHGSNSPIEHDKLHGSLTHFTWKPNSSLMQLSYMEA